MNPYFTKQPEISKNYEHFQDVKGQKKREEEKLVSKKNGKGRSMQSNCVASRFQYVSLLLPL